MTSDAIAGIEREEPWDRDAAEVPLPDEWASPGRLFVGSLSAAVNPRFYRDCGIGRVLTVAAGMDDAKIPEGGGDGSEVERLVVKIHDHPMADILEVLPRCLRFVHEGLADGRGVLVHCASGVSRSVTVCAAYVMFTASVPGRGGIGASDAIASVAATRKYANPNLGFRRQLDVLERRIALDSAEGRGRNGGSLEDFIAIIEEAQKVFSKTRVNVVEDAIRQRDAADGLHARADALEGELAALKSEAGGDSVGGAVDSKSAAEERKRIQRDLLLLQDELDTCLPLDDPPARMIRRAASSKVKRLLDDLFA